MIWQDFSILTQDLLILLGFLLPIFIFAFFLIRGFSPYKLVLTLFKKNKKINILIASILSLSLGIALALTSSERAFNEAMSKAADKFDLIITAPGSKIDMMLASVYLKPIDAPLLEGKYLDELNANKKVEFAVPIAYGDSYKGFSVVGSTIEFVKHLSDKKIKGSYFNSYKEAVIGAGVALEIGDTFSPIHGHEEDKNHEEEEHEDEHDIKIKVVGKMALTNTPWDKAIITPIENVWLLHGLGNGHALDEKEKLGLPFNKKYFPGTPAILVKAKKLGFNYYLASRYTTNETMAFFPGTVLAKLHSLLSDVRIIVSSISNFTLVLVLLSILSTLILLGRLFSSKFALLRAIGAPKRFIFSIMWLYISLLILIASLFALIIAYIFTYFISSFLSEHLSILVQASFSFTEIHLLAGFLLLSVLLGLVPAFLAYKQDLLKNLRN